MKRSSAFVWVCLFQFFLGASLCYGQYYTKNLSRNGWYGDFFPRMNDNGQVVWEGEPVPEAQGDQDSEIFLYDGTKAIQITDNDYPDSMGMEPLINGSGNIVWAGCPRGMPDDCNYEDWEIFLYNGSDVIQLTDDYVYDGNPQISDNGQIAWQTCDGTSGTWTVCEGGDLEIVLFDGTTTIQITDNTWDDGGWPGESELRMNASGQMAWTGCPNGAGGSCVQEDMEIFLYDGTSIIQMTDDSLPDRYPRINNQGQLVWVKEDGDTEIFFYDGTDTIQLTDDSYDDWMPDLNNHGQVVWHKLEEFLVSDVYFYDGTSVVQLTHDGNGNGAAKINDSGQVAWYNGWIQTAEVFVYDGSKTIQLTKNLWPDGPPEINNSGQVAWDTYWITEVEENQLIVNNEIFCATPGASLWGAASVVGTGNEPGSARLNYVFVLVVPFAGLLLMRALRRAGQRSRR